MLGAHRGGAAPPGPGQLRCSIPLLVLAPVPPLLAVLGAASIDNGNGAGVSLSGFALVGLLAAGTLLGDNDRGRAGVVLVIYVLGVTVLWSFSARSRYLYGYDVHQELATLARVAQAEMWRPRTGDAYNASLSLTTVPAALHSLTGVSGLALFKVAYPAIFALFPVSVAVLLLRFVGRVSTLGLTILVAMNPIGFWQISAVARQELALVLFAALLLAVMVSGGSRAARTGFVLVVVRRACWRITQPGT